MMGRNKLRHGIMGDHSIAISSWGVLNLIFFPWDLQNDFFFLAIFIVTRTLMVDR